MLLTQMVRCPDCGQMAQKHFQVGVQNPDVMSTTGDISQVTARTECASCDYCLEICMTTGQVLSSHIPSVVQLSVPSKHSSKSNPSVSRQNASVQAMPLRQKSA